MLVILKAPHHVVPSLNTVCKHLEPQPSGYIRRLRSLDQAMAQRIQARSGFCIDQEVAALSDGEASHACSMHCSHIARQNEGKSEHL